MNIYSKSNDWLGKALTNVHYAKDSKTEYDLTDVDKLKLGEINWINPSNTKLPNTNRFRWAYDKYDVDTLTYVDIYGYSVESWYLANTERANYVEKRKRMKLLIQHKLQKYPELLNEITKRGGAKYLKQCKHIVNGKSKWEGEGHKSMFIRTLVQAYNYCILPKPNYINYGEVIESPNANGLKMYENFLTEKESNWLTKEIENLIELGKNGKLLNNEMSFNAAKDFNKNRTQINFGYYYSYGFDNGALEKYFNKYPNEFEQAVNRVIDHWKNYESWRWNNSNDRKVLNQARIYVKKGAQPVDDQTNTRGAMVAGIPVEPMSKWLNGLVNRMITLDIIDESNRYDSALINIYPPGGEIPGHIDDVPSFEPNVATIRLKNPSVMTFGLNYSKKQVNDFFEVELPVGSLLIMSGNSATKIPHSVQSEHTKDWTYSITLRKVKVDNKYKPNNLKSYYGL